MPMVDRVVIRVQNEDFDLNVELANMRLLSRETGAIANFVGIVRDLNDGDSVATLHLEHYPGMTESSIRAIVEDAFRRWELLGAIVVHRIGKLEPSDQIVLVAVSSKHRDEAFRACEFIMDYLKTRAPFWKKELTPKGERWVDARDSDLEAARRWDE
ncbi:MAG: molybdopterin synthase catalytic subunit [Oceanicoccus sp.]|jgi:molybdopterin synthase catalytic subunit